MAGFDPEKLIRVEGKDIWIKATPGRLDTFLCQYFDKGNMEGRNVGAAQRFLALLEYVSGRSLNNDKVLTTCDVYVIASGNLVKIGVAADPADRLRRLQTGSGLACTLVRTWRLPRRTDAFALESAAHRAFKDHWVRGEWFDVTPEAAVQEIEALLSRGLAQSSADDAQED